MKIGDECWVTVDRNGRMTSGALNCSRDSAEVLRCFDDELVRVRIVPADEWQTMESAPKDGTEVLLWDQFVRIGSYRLDLYQEDEGKRWLANDHDDFSTGWASTPLDPTHWRPLPPGPEVK